jgi:hypothetical protein
MVNPWQHFESVESPDPGFGSPVSVLGVWTKSVYQVINTALGYQLERTRDKRDGQTDGQTDRQTLNAHISIPLIDSMSGLGESQGLYCVKDTLRSHYNIYIYIYPHRKKL